MHTAGDLLLQDTTFRSRLETLVAALVLAIRMFVTATVGTAAAPRAAAVTQGTPHKLLPAIKSAMANTDVISVVGPAIITQLHTL